MTERAKEITPEVFSEDLGSVLLYALIKCFPRPTIEVGRGKLNADDSRGLAVEVALDELLEELRISLSLVT